MTDRALVAELREWWGNETVDDMLLALATDGRKEMSQKKFLENCITSGGNWGGMLLTGIRHYWPHVWEAIPNDMGINAWGCICDTMFLCGVQQKNC